jgi:hypothetical protein
MDRAIAALLGHYFILNRCSSSNSADLIRLRKRVILVKCKPFVVYFLSLNFCYSILAKTTIVANLKSALFDDEHLFKMK